MQLRIQNYRGIENAEIQLSDKITLIAAENHSGKSSIMQALAAILSGAEIPVAGIAKNAAGVLVRTGASAGSIELANDTGSARLALPSCKTTSDGSGLPTASEYATGRRDLLKLDPKKLPLEMVKITGGEPDANDLDIALAYKGVAASRREAAVLNVFGKHDEKGRELVKAKGWETSHDLAKNTGIEMKAKFEALTGKRWGSAQGGIWLPDGWTDDLTGASKDSLEAEAVQAKEALESMIAVNAVEQHERQKLAELVASKDELLEDVQKWQAARKEHEENYKKLQEEAPRAPGLYEKTYHCPECKTELALAGDQLTKPSGNKPSKTEHEKQKEAFDAAQKKIATAKAAYENANLALRLAHDKATAAARAEKTLAELAEQPAQDAAALEETREAVRVAEQRLAAFLKKTQADAIHASIMDNQKVVDILAPGGLRAEKLSKSLKEFNTRLADLSTIAGWGTVQVSDQLTGTLGGREYGLLSASEQFRVDVIVRAAVALIDHSAMILVDAADILDRKSRGGLFKMLLSLRIPAVVAATVSVKKDGTKDGLPNMEKFGAAYWLSNGRADEVSERVAV